MSTPPAVELRIFEATTREERERIYRFRYDIYVDEMGRYRDIADHENRWLEERVDAQSRVYIAAQDDQVAGTMRWTWGGDSPLPDRHINQYALERFLEKIPREQIIVGERFMVSPTLRGSDLIFQLFRTYLSFVNDNRIQLVFGDCEPHLLNLYLGMGFRTYATRNFNSPDAGYLIPLLMVPEDTNYLRSINSPLVHVLRDFGADAAVPDCLHDLLADGGAVVSERLMETREYWTSVYSSLGQIEQARLSPFDGLGEEQIRQCIGKSSLIDCAMGDRIVKKGNTAKNMYIILSGIVEVRDDERRLAFLTAGDVFGEMAFLTGAPRVADVNAMTDDVRVLSLSESELRKTIEQHPEIAAKMLLNIAKMLCARLVKSAG